MKNATFMKILLFFTILILNTGCYYSLFEKEVKPEPTPIVTQKVTTTVPAPTSTVSTPSFEDIAPECTDDLNAVNSCHKGPIQPTELKPKHITQTGGEVHKLKSFQGQKFTIIERSNGYLFPELKNKIVILEIFGKNCSHCLKEMPIMNKLHHRYGKNLEIIAIQVEGEMSKTEAKTLIKRHHIAYPIVSGKTATNLQYHIQNTYGWTGILPFIMVIKDGVTEFTYRGQVSHREINHDIKSLIN